MIYFILKFTEYTLDTNAMSNLFLIAFSHNPVNFLKSLVTGSLSLSLSLSSSLPSPFVKEKAGWWIKCGEAERLRARAVVRGE